MLKAVRGEQAKRKAEADRQFTRENAEKIREECQSLAGFVRHAWHVLEPNTTYLHNWHIDAICEHLEAVTRGDINRLLINVPPGTMKSLLVSVMWPAWEWGPKGLSSKRNLTTAHALHLALRDSRKMRNLIQSEWFQTLWPLRLIRSGDGSFENERMGNREATAFSGLTGGRGDNVILDDPHSTEDAESDAERATAIRILKESLPSRVNDPIRSAIVVIMQRLHEGDVSGEIIKAGGYVHLMLPMEFDVSRRCTTSIGFQDPRTYEGQLLFPGRYPREVIERDKKDMTPYAISGQWQQQPTPRDGAYFMKSWFKRYRDRPANLRYYMSSDHAPTAGKNSDYSCVRVWGLDEKKDLYLIDGRRMHTTMDKMAEFASEMIRKWDPCCWFPEDDNNWKAAAPFIMDELRKRNQVIRIEPMSPHGADKVAKAQSFEGMAALGRVWIAEGPEGDEIIQQYITFPAAANDDEVDAAAIMGRAIIYSHPAIIPPEPKGPESWRTPADLTFDEAIVKMAAQEPGRI